MKQVKNVLLIDDDEITNYINSMLIKAAAATENVHMALNGKEALNYLKKHCSNKPSDEYCPMLIFLDLNMPIMDGFEFLEKFTTLDDIHKEGLPVYVLTSSENTKDISKANKYGISGYVSKPLTRDKIDKIVKNVLEG